MSAWPVITPARAAAKTYSNVGSGNGGVLETAEYGGSCALGLTRRAGANWGQDC